MKGDKQIAQRRSSGGMFLILMLEAERRKSNCAVVVFSSDSVVGEMGIVVFVLFVCFVYCLGRKKA